MANKEPKLRTTLQTEFWLHRPSSSLTFIPCSWNKALVIQISCSCSSSRKSIYKRKPIDIQTKTNWYTNENQLIFDVTRLKFFPRFVKVVSFLKLVFQTCKNEKHFDHYFPAIRRVKETKFEVQSVTFRLIIIWG